MVHRSFVRPPSGSDIAFMDACRAFFVLLGIVVHAAEPFAAIRNAAQGSEGIDYVLFFVWSFRMPAFFMIAGFFAAPAFASGDPLAWFGKRAARLGIPLAFGVVFIVPLESIALSLPELGRTEGWLPIVQAAFAYPHGPSHLWFILDLLVVSALLAILVRCIGGTWLARCFEVLAGCLARHLVILGTLGLLGLSAYLVLVETVQRSWLSDYLYVSGHAAGWGAFDAVRIAKYIPFFAFGIVLFHSRALLARFSRPSPAVVLLALVFLLAIIFLPKGAAGRTYAALWAPAAIFLTSMWMQAGRLVTPHLAGSIRWLSRGSYTIYVVHQPIVAFAAVGALALGLRPEAGFAVTLGIGALMSVGFFWLVQDSRIAALVLNGRLPFQARGGRAASGGEAGPAGRIFRSAQ
jgi:glucans biosynthesis protein C